MPIVNQASKESSLRVVLLDMTSGLLSGAIRVALEVQWHLDPASNKDSALGKEVASRLALPLHKRLGSSIQGGGA